MVSSKVAAIIAECICFTNSEARYDWCHTGMRLIAYLALFMAAVSAIAQTDFRGTVTRYFGQPVANATVRVLDGGTRETLAKVSTDQSGRFEVRGLPPGHYEVAVAAPGFTSRLMSTGQLFAKEATVRTIELEGDCDAPDEDCDPSGILAISDPHPVVLTRDVTLGLNEAIDLDSGLIVSPNSPSAGLQLVSQRGGVRLLPLHDVKIDSVQRGTWDAGIPGPPSFRVDGLNSATEISACRKSHCSKIFFTSDVPVAPQSIQVHLVTRR